MCTGAARQSHVKDNPLRIVISIPESKLAQATIEMQKRLISDKIEFKKELTRAPTQGLPLQKIACNKIKPKNQ